MFASRSSATTLAELRRANRLPLDDQKFAEVLESLRRRFEWIGFRANYRARDGQLSWRGDDGSHRFAAFNLMGGGGKREKNRGKKERETRQEPQY